MSGLIVAGEHILGQVLNLHLDAGLAAFGRAVDDDHTPDHAAQQADGSESGAQLNAAFHIAIFHEGGANGDGHAVATIIAHDR